MADSSIIQSTRPYIIPAVTTLLGLTGLSGGIYALTSPLDAIRPFGLYPPSSTTTKSNSDHASLFQTSLIRIYALRNIGTGLSLLGLTSLWVVHPEGAVKETIKRCIGLSLSFGTVVALGDAVVVNAFVDGLSGAGDDEAESGQTKVREQAKGAAKGHAIVSIVILGLGVRLLLA